MDKRPVAEWVRIASTFKTRTEWARTNGAEYCYALRHRHLREACLKKLKSTRRSYLLKQCQGHARQFKTHKAWRKADPCEYDAVRRKGWMKLCDRHMRHATGAPRKWTYRKCLASARRFRYLAHWIAHAQGHRAYMTARHRGWLKRIVKTAGLKRCPGARWFYVYAYEFEGKLAYVGVTRNLAQRHRAHKAELLRKYKATRYTVLTDAVPMEKACAAEQRWINRYAKKFKMLNRRHAYSLGGLGLTSRYTLERCVQSASAYRSLKSWTINCRPHYAAAHRYGWLEHCKRAISAIS